MYDPDFLFEHPKQAPAFLVAEIGINHEGKLEQARQLIAQAAKSGADAVKFQIFKTEDFIHPHLQAAAFELFKKYELSYSDFDQLQEDAKEQGLIFFATPLDLRSLDYLSERKIPLVKIASSDFQSYPLLEAASKKFKHIILSSGMNSEAEILEGLKIFDPKQIALLYCLSLYPTPPEAIRLSILQHWSQKFNFPIGFSDHSQGIHFSLAAIALGAKIIERHFSLDPTQAGADHAVSLSPTDFKTMSRQIRELEQAISEEKIKIPTKQENEIRKFAFRDIFAAKQIPKGKIFEKDDFLFLRPGQGISKDRYSQLLKMQAHKDLKPYEKI